MAVLKASSVPAGANSSGNFLVMFHIVPEKNPKARKLSKQKTGDCPLIYNDFIF
jgi:hypothetical protein